MASVVTAVAEERPPVGFDPVGDGVGEGVGEGGRDGVALPSVGVAEAVVGALSGTDCSPVGSAVPDGAVSVQPTRAAASTAATIHRPTIIGP
jgi:hypothetical protein